jgi:glutamate dehydrogenase
LPEDPSLSRELEAYFPERLRDQFAEQLQRHPLRREIIASRVANELVNRAGTTFAFRLGDETGAGAPDIARAYTVAHEVFRLRELTDEVEALDGKVPALTQVEMLLAARVLLERTTRWLLRHRRRPLDIAATIAHFTPGAAALADALPTLLAASEREAAEAKAVALASAEVPDALAQRVAHLEALVPALDLVEIAASTGLDVVAVADVYHTLGRRLDLHWLRNHVIALPRTTRWEAMARAALRDDVYTEHASLTAEVLKAQDDPAPRERLESWLTRNAAAVERCLQVLADIRTTAAPDLARLSVAVREIRNLIHSSGTPQPTAPAATAHVAPR